MIFVGAKIGNNFESSKLSSTFLQKCFLFTFQHLDDGYEDGNGERFIYRMIFSCFIFLLSEFRGTDGKSVDSRQGCG